MAPATRKPWHRRWWHVCMKTLRGVTRLEDTPYRIAMGSACGMSVALLPIFGQMLLGMGLARLMRSNVIASMPWTWITNPLTTFPIWYGCYRVGSMLLMRDSVQMSEIHKLFHRVDSDGLFVTLREGGSLLLGILLPLWLGTLLIGVMFGAIVYVLVFRAVSFVQARRAERLRRWGDIARASSSSSLPPG